MTTDIPGGQTFYPHGNSPAALQAATLRAEIFHSLPIHIGVCLGYA
ncbi:hypothetical protein [Halomonas cupida]